MVESWTIWGRKSNGNVVRCFTWRGEPRSGIAKARQEAHEWDYDLGMVWAEHSVLDTRTGRFKPVVVRG